MTRGARVAAFAGVGVLGIGVQVVTVWGGMRWGGLGPTFATACGVSAAVVHNFAWHRRWTWGDRRVTGRSTWAAFGRFVAANGIVSLAGNLAIVWLLVHLWPLGGVAANLIAIGLMAVANYWASDRLVFVARRAAATGH